MDDEDLRRRLIGRIAVALVAILGLLASLTVFDSLTSPEPPAKVATQPPLAAPPPAATAQVTPAASTPAESAPPVAPAPSADTPPATAVVPPPPAADTTLAAAKPTPEQTSSPGAPPLVPLPAEKPLTKPAAARQAMVRQSEPALQLPPPMAVRPDPQREIARAPLGGVRNAPPSRPLSQATQGSPAGQPSQVGPGVSRQFALQLGVFNNLANAEELRAKLELQGIPSTIEARVQVGPFSTREEVESVRAKLRALGMESGIMVSLRK